ncbi:hypothetical protein [Amycolatopsis orientalis]|uniref:hypothetical protein n=1 Tax=Amycolatopsis orientalis TaxID=31958 RepID=UPI00041DCE11|nr:hypothetical protein [Amycolatopsis orientalis]
MRKNAAFLAVATVVTLALATPAAATASEGEFTYWHYGDNGELQSVTLEDPPSGDCFDLPELTDAADDYAFRSFNQTDSAATVFKGDGCQGDSFVLDVGARGSDGLLFRSVIFD